jgi:predicted Zn finger-like uncharacterized protein
VKFTIVCQQCRSKLSVSTSLIGKKVRCPKCKETIRLHASSPTRNRKSTHDEPSDETEVWNIDSDASVLSDSDYRGAEEQKIHNAAVGQPAEPPIARERKRPLSREEDSSDVIPILTTTTQPSWPQLVPIGLAGILVGTCFGYLAAPRRMAVPPAANAPAIPVQPLGNDLVPAGQDDLHTSATEEPANTEEPAVNQDNPLETETAKPEPASENPDEPPSSNRP